MKWSKSNKSRILKTRKYNSIAINFLEDRYSKNLTLGLILMQKSLGIDRVYEWKDGIYIQVNALWDQASLYAVEIFNRSNQNCVWGPKFIQPENYRGQSLYHITIDNDYLKKNRCEDIEAINFIAAYGQNNQIRYGNSGDEFDQNFPEIGVANWFLYPEMPVRLNWSISMGQNQYPTHDEFRLIKAGDFREPDDDQNKENAIPNFGGNIPSREEDKANSLVMEFSTNDFKGNSRPYNGPRRGTTMSSSSKFTSQQSIRQNGTRNFGRSNTTHNPKVLKIRTTKSSQLRKMINRDKNNHRSGRMSTIREEPKGKQNIDFD